MSPFISQLYIYPLKSCAGISVNELYFDEKGPLLDRRWMLVDRITGTFLSQRTVLKMALIQAEVIDGAVWVYQAMNKGINNRLQLPVMSASCDASRGANTGANTGALEPTITVQVWDDRVQAYDCGDEAAEWFSTLLNTDCRLVYQGDCQRFASDKYADKHTQVSFADGFPLLAVAQSSIDLLNKDCVAHLDSTHFRPNIVVSNSLAFAEKSWSALTTQTMLMKVVKPCERCVIPTINPRTAQTEPAILTALKTHCIDNNRIIFGQNLTFKTLNAGFIDDKNSLHIQQKLSVGDVLLID